MATKINFADLSKAELQALKAKTQEQLQHSHGIVKVNLSKKLAAIDEALKAKGKTRENSKLRQVYEFFDWCKEQNIPNNIAVRFARFKYELSAGVAASYSTYWKHERSMA